MCGGLVLAATGSKRRLQVPYHLSRLIGYLALGSLAGLIGNKILLQIQILPLQVLTGFVLAVSFLYFAYQLWFGRESGFHGMGFSSKFLSRSMGLAVKFPPAVRAAWVGFLSAFLPCGWLYLFVLLSLASHHPVTGAITLAAFWVGTLPATTLAPEFFRHVFSRLTQNSRKGVAVLLVFAAFFSMFEHYQAFQAISHKGSDPLNCVTGHTPPSR